MTDHDPAPSDGENIFSMDPQQVVWEQAKALIDGQQALAALRRDAASTAASADPATAQRAYAIVRRLEKTWYTEMLPSVAASIKVAVEVFETFGPGRTTITDPTDAAIWNNKYFVWAREFGAEATPPQS